MVFSCREQENPRILVFSKTMDNRHESIDAGNLAIITLGRVHGFEVDTTADASFINEENLKRYRAVVFLNTTENVLNVVQQADFKRFIEAGGGFVGIHAAADTEYEWPWYGRLVGAYFSGHPEIQKATVRKVKPFGKDITPDSWTRIDEWYNYKNISPDITVIYNLDESSYQGGENGENHPIAWYHEFEGGRSFYTGMGHVKESFADTLYLNHLLQGITYALGDSPLDYTKAKTKRAPEENRFTKTILEFNLNEPTEMAILPDGRIMFLERRGDVKLYDPVDGKVNIINTFNVSTKFEDGMIGLAIDPNFAQNQWVYIFYSHPEKSANVVSRFVFADNRLDMTSEKQIIEVATQREECCHTGGSMSFGPDGNLYISTGDNTSPFASDGFSPSDERPGRSPFDAQKSSGNTNDLRGKILRIHLETDGTYTIPEGNLFPIGEEKTRPEIYVMGCRNPYRISIDEKTGFLYWGEVGPDAGNNDSLRGSRGYDEVNQAKKAGNFGWPHFVGNNYAYAKYDFAAKKALNMWDPGAPINESPNNTGKRELPAVSPAFIWYPYTNSEEFPMLKEGGRTAMAGPVYYSENFLGVPTAFPDYFDGKLLIYDWIRNWMFLVSMDQQGSIEDIEPFMPNTKFNNMVDMAYGPDGKLYMLEYGTIWSSQNLDARLVRIDYNGGNRPPVAQLSADKTAGATPLTVTFSAKGTFDPDGDSLTYELAAGGQVVTSKDGNFTLTFDEPQAIHANLTVKDDKGGSGSAQVQLVVGNELPVVTITITRGNKTFFFPRTPAKYVVTVQDKEDGSTLDGKVAPGDVRVTFDYLKGFDMAMIAQGHQMPTTELPGKVHMEKSDCKSCHVIDQKSAGPSFKDIAAKYNGQTGAIDLLAAKIIKGGAGVWGKTEMAAHPQISVEDAKKMVVYILSLNDKKVEVNLPLAGTVIPGRENDGAYMLTATYTDKGAGKVRALSSSNSIVLRSASLLAAQADELHIARKAIFRNNWTLDNVRNGAYAVYKNLDLTGVRNVSVTTFIRDMYQNPGGDIEVRLDAPDGKLMATVKASRPGLSTLPSKMENTTGYHDLFVVFKNPQAVDKSMFYFNGIQLEN
ncbi:MAG: ThuA domain-containing protein [Cyclobacteriaceae bacterium]|nr:ThuA domain-containing protein [Cyclobacteriaceae bacterium]